MQVAILDRSYHYSETCPSKRKRELQGFGRHISVNGNINCMSAFEKTIIIHASKYVCIAAVKEIILIEYL